MSEREHELYEAQLHRLEGHVHRAEDGTFYLDVDDGKRIDVDPVFFADFKRSVDETNQLIKRGVLKAADVSLF